MAIKSSKFHFRKTGKWEEMSPHMQKDKVSPYVAGEHMGTLRDFCRTDPASGRSSHTSELHDTCGPLPSFPSFHRCVGKSEAHVKETVTRRDEEGKKLMLLPISLFTSAFSVSDHWVPGINILRAKTTPTQPQFGKLSFCCVVWCAFGLLCLLVR